MELTGREYWQYINSLNGLQRENDLQLRDHLTEYKMLSSLVPLVQSGSLESKENSTFL
ncbi:mCG124481 [Mus musculus]|nr:mCG124481 [Mus musculus]